MIHCVDLFFIIRIGGIEASMYVSWFQQILAVVLELCQLLPPRFINFAILSQ